MNRYKGEWLVDYCQFLWQARELMKSDAYKHLCDDTLSDDEKLHYAKRIIVSHYMRSVQAFVDGYGKRKTHPNFEEYAAMILNQDDYLNNIPKNIRDKLVCEFGKMKGIEKGTYYFPAAK